MKVNKIMMIEAMENLPEVESKLKGVVDPVMAKAKLDAEKKLVEANAEKQANELKNQTLTDQVLQEKLIEKWNGSLPSYYGGESGLFKLFGLDK